MTPKRTRITTLEFKPDFAEAVRRWEAYFAGDLVDRPVVCVTAPKPGAKPVAGPTYYERAHGDFDEVIDKALGQAEATFYAGEAIPAFWGSFGCDETAVLCGARFVWKEGSGDTVWSEPFVEDWDRSLPLRLQEDHPLWRRMLELYRRAADRVAGKMAMTHIDLHTNMDLVAAVRGAERLCLDVIDRPETIDRAMQSARAVFPAVWRGVAEAGRMDELGYGGPVFSWDGATSLQCDFSCLISPAMFNRWVMPALEEEAALVKHAYYHWDGPAALVHADAILASRGLHTLGFVPGEGRGPHLKYLDLLKQWQRAGKSVHAWGTPDELKLMHRELQPNKVLYSTGVATAAEADALLKWFVRNT